MFLLKSYRTLLEASMVLLPTCSAQVLGPSQATAPGSCPHMWPSTLWGLFPLIELSFEG